MKREAGFSGKVIAILQKRAAFICSNPKCKILTIAPSLTDNERVSYIGKAAHIVAAQKNGPRYDASANVKYRSSLENAIFLCSNCADLIDKNNGIDYPKELLKSWKDNHESWIKDNLNKSIVSPVSSTVNVNIDNRKTKSVSAGFYIEKYEGRLPKSQTDQNRDYDIRVYKKLDKLLTLDKLKYVLDRLASDDSIFWADRKLLDKFLLKAKHLDLSFLDDNLQSLKNQFLIDLEELLSFLTFNFFAYHVPDKESDPTGDSILFCLYPRLNVEREGSGEPGEGQKYARFQMELDEKIGKTWKSYSDYRELYRNFLKGNPTLSL